MNSHLGKSAQGLQNLGGGEHLNHRRRVLNDFAFDGLLTPCNRDNVISRGREGNGKRVGGVWEAALGNRKKKSNGDENTCAKTQLRLK